MDREALISELKRKKEISFYVSQVKEDLSMIPLLFDLIDTDKTSLKFACEKVIRSLSSTNPDLLYPYFDRMAKLLYSENSFIKWGFIQSLPGLIRIDQDHKWPAVSARYFSLLDSSAVVTFVNAVAGIPQILSGYPEYENKLVTKLLHVDEHLFLSKGEPSPECTNVAKEQIMDCFDAIYKHSSFQKEILIFAQANWENNRKKVAVKAKRFLKEHTVA